MVWWFWSLVRKRQYSVVSKSHRELEGLINERVTPRTFFFFFFFFIPRLVGSNSLVVVNNPQLFNPTRSSLYPLSIPRIGTRTSTSTSISTSKTSQANPFVHRHRKLSLALPRLPFSPSPLNGSLTKMVVSRCGNCETYFRGLNCYECGHRVCEKCEQVYPDLNTNMNMKGNMNRVRLSTGKNDKEERDMGGRGCRV